jgi:hypothetical protein
MDIGSMPLLISGFRVQVPGRSPKIPSWRGDISFWDLSVKTRFGHWTIAERAGFEPGCEVGYLLFHAICNYNFGDCGSAIDSDDFGAIKDLPGGRPVEQILGSAVKAWLGYKPALSEH